MDVNASRVSPGASSRPTPGAAPLNETPPLVCHADVVQDDPQTDAMTPDGTVYAFSSWGGAPANATSPQPPTMHVFNVSSGAVLAEIPTPGSLEEFDMALDPTPGSRAVLVLATGLDMHANIGSNGGMAFLWRVELQ